MLKIKDLTCVRSENTPLEKMILQNLSLEVEAGEFVIILGGNGAGKSTLFQTLCGHLRPRSGTITVGERQLSEMSLQERSKAIACVLQDPKVGTYPNLTVMENFVLAEQRGASRQLSFYQKNQSRERYFAHLKQANLGLENFLDRFAYELSGGQRQAISFMMAILGSSEILLLDEMTAALDPKSSEQLMALANRIIRERSQTCLMITHDLEQALQYGDRLLILENGKFLHHFSKEEKSQLSPKDFRRLFGH